jgi:uncharacterized protein
MLRAWDVPGDSGVALRNSLRASHTESVTAQFEKGTVLVGAGIYDDQGAVRGSLLILECDGRADVDAYLESEPFHTGGLWETVEISELMLPDMYLGPLRRS